MHKDKPPGVFDIAERPTRYVIFLGLVTGFVASVLAFAVYVIATGHFQSNAAPWSTTANNQPINP